VGQKEGNNEQGYTGKGSVGKFTSGHRAKPRQKLQTRPCHFRKINAAGEVEI
jgi:hypothetical protein